MSRFISLIVVEGALEVPVSLKLLESLGISTDGLFPVNKGGRTSFWRDAPRYNRAAASLGPVLGLTDLESHPCPSGLIQAHLPAGRHVDFVLRVAERTLESWLLADRSAVARFLKISEAMVPRDPEAEQNPKRTLVNLARRSPLKLVQEDLVPASGSAGIVGKGYTPRMTEFVKTKWRPSEASRNSESLKRAMAAIEQAVKSK